MNEDNALTFKPKKCENIFKETDWSEHMESDKYDMNRTLRLTVKYDEKRIFFDAVLFFEKGYKFIPIFQIISDLEASGFVFNKQVSINHLTQTEKNKLFLNGWRNLNDLFIWIDNDRKDYWANEISERLWMEDIREESLNVHVIDDEELNYSVSKISAYGRCSKYGTFFSSLKDFENFILNQFEKYEEEHPGVTVVVTHSDTLDLIKNNYYTREERGNDFYMNILSKDFENDKKYRFASDEDKFIKTSPHDIVLVSDEYDLDISQRKVDVREAEDSDARKSKYDLKESNSKKIQSLMEQAR